MDTAPKHSPLPEAWMLGDWRVEPGLNRLSRGAEARLLEPKTMAVLVVLCQRHGEVVSSDELITAVWDDRPMGDNPVYKSIAKLRRALDDDPTQPSLIVTVQKKGYQLVAPMSTQPPQAPSAMPTQDRRRSTRRRWWSAAAGAIAGIALAGMGIGLWMSAREAPSPWRIERASTGPGSQVQPSLSPDGRAYAFVSDVGGAPHVWIQVIGESTARQLTDGLQGDSRPRWSPDGQSVLFGRAGALWLVPAAGGTPRELVRDAYHPNWSRDGRRIVFERRYQIWTADAGGGNQMRVEGLPVRELALAPRWPAFSPDGERIVFFDSGSNPLGDLWTIAIAGGEPQRLTTAPAIGSAPVWSVDGRHIVYSSRRGGSRTLWRVDVAARSAEALGSSSGDDDFPDLSLDGRLLIYSNTRERFKLVRSEPGSGQTRVLHDSRLPLFQPSLSPDGNRIAFFGEVQDGSYQIFTIASEGGSPTSHAPDAMAMHALPQWSGDGRSLYFYRSGRRADDAAFSRAAVAGGGAETVVDGWNWNVANGARVHPLEAEVIYSRLIGQTPVQTLIRDLATGRDRTFHATLEYPRWSTDGSIVTGSLFVDQRFPGDVAICPLAGPACRVVAPQARIPVWSRDETGLYFVRGFGLTQDLFLVGIDGAMAERKLMTMAPLHPLGPFYDVTERGEVLWIRHEKDPGEIWLAEPQPD